MIAANMMMPNACELSRMMADAHRRKLDLCAALEDIADSLPGPVDVLKCLCVANSLVPLLRDIHRIEETVVFPTFEARQGNGAARSTQRLRAEHVEDEAFAYELTEVLLTIGHGAAIPNPEAVGFMLRGFFETIRRHVAFEREHILPVISADAL